MSESLVRAEHLGRRYRRSSPWAIRDVSFRIPGGSITALVGPNGAGKSTLIRACMGFERPDEGRVLVAGVDPRRDRVTAVNSIGYVPQAAALYRRMTIADHLDMAQVGRRSFDRSYALSLLRRVGLTEARTVGQLSGGEQSQVALGLALGSRAPLLLLDEPLASLDPLARRDFLTTLVDEIRHREATAILSSHIVTDIEQACDRLVVLVGGRLALDASVADVQIDHRTIESQDVADHAVIGTFNGPKGDRLALIQDASAGRPASLDEVVLGYLAAARPSAFEDVA